MVSEICSIPECGEPKWKREWCGRHYRMQWEKSRPKCSITGCDNPKRGKDLCGKHYQQWKRGDTSLGLPLPDLDTCEAGDCAKPATVAGMCNAHYLRKRRHGDPLAGDVAKMRDVDAKFKARTVREGDCLVWTAGQKSSGYGKIMADGRSQPVHRWAYERFVGPIPEGMDIDHICFNRLCCEPSHLRVTTRKQNVENHQGAPVNSTTGVRGVWRRSKDGKLVAEVSHNGRKYHVGFFDDLAKAEAAVIAKRNELFTHNDIDRLAA